MTTRRLREKHDHRVCSNIFTSRRVFRTLSPKMEGFVKMNNGFKSLIIFASVFYKDDEAQNR